MKFHQFMPGDMFFNLKNPQQGWTLIVAREKINSGTINFVYLRHGYLQQKLHEGFDLVTRKLTIIRNGKLLRVGTWEE